jgi:hypothetical protein
MMRGRTLKVFKVRGLKHNLVFKPCNQDRDQTISFRIIPYGIFNQLDVEEKKPVVSDG